MNQQTNNISIIWDFDKTLTVEDSTTVLIKYFVGDAQTSAFWQAVKKRFMTS